MSKGKVLLKIGYTQFVMESRTATTMFQMLADTGVELYDPKWNNETRKQEPRVKETDASLVSLSILSAEDYAVGKLLHAADEAAKQGEAK